MRTTRILLLCMLGAALLLSVMANNGNGPDDCCFKFYPRRVDMKLIRSYYMSDARCPKSGVILLTERYRRICLNPSLSWVQRIIKTLDERAL